MNKAAQTLAATNVLAFPARAAKAPAKAVRRGLKTEGANVLKFTGVRRYNYDRETLLAKHKQRMQEQVTELFGQVFRGEVTGLALSVTVGGPENGAKTTFHGLLAEEYNLTRRIAKGVFEYSEQQVSAKGMFAWADEE